jgi:hypothetical protein
VPIWCIYHGKSLVLVSKIRRIQKTDASEARGVKAYFPGNFSIIVTIQNK